MVGVASQIIFCIFLAAIIGFMGGFLIRGIRHQARLADLERLWQSRVADRDSQLQTLRTASIANGSTAATDVPMPNENHVIDSSVIARSGEISPERRNDTPDALASRLLEPTGNGQNQFEDKLTQALSLIENLARSQHRMESELTALRSVVPVTEFKLEPPNNKS